MLSAKRQWAGVALSCTLALVYALSFGHAYTSYISPVYEYAHYRYFPASLSMTLAAYVFAVMPCLFMRWTEAPSSFGISLLYTLCCVPTQLMMLFNWNRDSAGRASGFVCSTLLYPPRWSSLATDSPCCCSGSPPAAAPE